MAKAMPTLPPDGTVDGGVDADHLAVEVEGGAARVTAVHRGVDLHVVVGARADVAALRRDDAGRHRAAEAERIADGNHPVTNARLLVGELDEGERSRVALILRSAMSVRESVPMSSASNLLSLSKLTWILLPPSMTWLLVTT